MSVTTTATHSSKLTWSSTDTQDYGDSYDNGTIGNDYNFAYGTGYMQVNTLWHKNATLASGGEDTYDLTNLSQSRFGDTSTVTFEDGTVKGICIENTSTGIVSTDYIVVGPSGAENPLSSPFGNDSSVSIPVYPSGSFSTMNGLDGHSVSSSAKNIRVANSGVNAADYDIVIVGRV